MQFKRKNRIRFFPVSSAGNLASESGSAILYILILTAISASLAAIVTNRADQYRTWNNKLEANAFVQDALGNFNQKLYCPGGVLGIRRGTCSEEGSIVLSINQLRRMVADATPHSVATLGVLPPAYRGYDYFEILHMRITCYKQERAINGAGQAMMTSLKQQPCVLLNKINTALTPYVGSSLLSGREDDFLDDVKTIEDRIVPTINSKIDLAQKEINRLTPLKNAAGNQVVADTASKKVALANYQAAYANLTSSMNAYKDLVAEYSRLAMQCSPSCSINDPRVPAITAAQTQMNAYYPTYEAAHRQAQAASNVHNAADAKLRQSINVFNDYDTSISTEAERISSYQTMIRYLGTITGGKNQVLRNSQLATLQNQGEVLTHLLRYGTRGGAYAALSRLPAPSDNGVSKISTNSSGEMASFRFGMLKLKPFCSQDSEGSPQLRFFAKVADKPAEGFPGVNVEIEFDRRRESIKKILDTIFPKKSSSGWTKMPVNFTPENCKLIEEDDPPVHGPRNWSQDSLKTPKAP